MLTTWYHPSSSGDFRLEADGDEKCTLTVVSPTPGEIDQLGKFLVKARKKDWIDDCIGLPDGCKVKSVIPIAGPLNEVGRVLVGRGQGIKRKDILTVVKSESGQVKFVTIGDGDDLEYVAGAPRDGKAVTTKRATLCCPEPVSGPDIRASEVLREFCTQRQWDDWNDYGFLICYGNLTGHAYRVCHRHTRQAALQGKITWDLDDDEVVHCYDWSFPPAEEVLSIKHQLEHAEHWIRNPSGYLHGDSVRFVNPFVPRQLQYGDGALDTGIMTAAGIMLPLVGPDGFGGAFGGMR